MSNILIYGGLLIDRYLIVDRYPAPGGDGFILDSADMVGGCAVNIAKAVKNLGGVPFIVSAVGNDHWGGTIMSYMQKERLPADCIRRTEGNTGYCFVFLEPNGERTFLTSKGCETEYTDTLVPKDTEDACRVAAVTGYYLLGDTSGMVTDRLRGFKRGGGKIVFDPCPLADKIKASYLDDMIGLSDVIAPNGQEARFLAGSQGYETPKQWALSCNQRGKSVIIKEGADGGTLYENGESTPYAAACAKTVDTTGAGDAFTGVIAYAVSEGIPLGEAVALAARAAGIIVSVKGPHGAFDMEALKC